MSNNDLLLVKGLKKFYPVVKGFFRRETAYVKAVNGVDIAIKKGEILGLVGESGCGKSTLGRCIIRLEEPTEGEIFFENKNILGYSTGALQRLRRNMQIIFQDPYTSLNPRKKVGQIIGEGFVIHKMYSQKERTERVKHLMDVVGLLPDQINRFPHEFSGGQRQRICLARALSIHPKFVIADEPVSALDVSIQAQILNLLIELQHNYDLTYLFISHDLSVVRHISDRVAVMYLGRIVEIASRHLLFSHPIHPYTKALMSAAPLTDPSLKKNRIILEGDVPSPTYSFAGCSFNSRCHYRQKICAEIVPSLIEAENGHQFACHYPLG
ncbi:MAG TPA: dipeptide ABC transporter ATP-binding protein [Desulfobacterales bacterium]|nr:dipeptide ABC transporter ATP-binding protein [Desulfobacterales bacterium]